MSPIILFIIRNLGTLEPLLMEFLALFPAKTAAGQASTAITTHPDAVAALNKIADDYATVNK